MTNFQPNQRVLVEAVFVRETSGNCATVLLGTAPTEANVPTSSLSLPLSPQAEAGLDESISDLGGPKL